MQFIVGVDVGGTFTDASAIRIEDGASFSAKVPTTPSDLLIGLLDALDGLAAEAALPTHDLLRGTVKFAHGTTQTSNVMFTWSGSKAGLITTEGFRDELLMMRARGRVAGLSLSERRHLRRTQKPPAIVPAERIVEVTERIDARGRVLVRLDRADAERAVDRLVGLGVEAIAVALLWSPRNPEHELLVADVIRAKAPGIHVTLSHEIAPVLGEYERASTASVNAYVAPTVEDYFRRVEGALRNRGLTVPVLVVQADGGVAQVAQSVPIRTIESGPAAGMVAVQALAQTVGLSDVIATDVGGTTFKTGLLVDGKWGFSRETIINQYTLLMPMVDLVSIGAGGGSIAWVDDSRLRIGPMSAGASPGPAAYGWGGEQATVTDADVALGFIDPARFLGGKLPLRPDLARSALQPIADQLFEGDVTRAAAGIRQVVDAQMADLVRKATLERGHDPRRFTLMAYGGAGPLHAASYAHGLGICRIVIPRNATVYSAYGAAASDLRNTVEISVDAGLMADTSALESAFAEIEERTVALLRQQGVEDGDIAISRSADMRYERQLHDIRVPLPASIRDQNQVIGAFENRYVALYGAGSRLPHARLQLLRIGVEAVGRTRSPDPRPSTKPPPPLTPSVDTRRIYWPEAGEWIETPAYDGAALSPGHVVAGPAVIDEPGTTVSLPRGATALIDPYDNFQITLDREVK